MQHRMSAANTDEGELEELCRNASLTDLLKGAALEETTIEQCNSLFFLNTAVLARAHPIHFFKFVSESYVARLARVPGDPLLLDWLSVYWYEVRKFEGACNYHDVRFVLNVQTTLLRVIRSAAWSGLHGECCAQITARQIRWEKKL